MKKMKVGVVGCGCISGIYFENLFQVFQNVVEVVGCCDLIPERSKLAAEKWNIRQYKVEDDSIYKDPNIDILLNLTQPANHYDVCRLALEHGKHVYVEKPLSTTLEQGKELCALAKKKGLSIGGAPDTFLGAGIQTCVKLIDEGWIGKPLSAVAFMTCHGHESWHPDPEFYYKTGAGPMFDMGPYYITALLALLGPAKMVSGVTKQGFPQRVITSQPKYGQIVDVEVPTHVAGLIEFQSGAVANVITSFDVWDAHLPRIEIYGTQGSLSVPDPNTFGGPVLLRTARDSQWYEIPLTHAYQDNSRGLGLCDMASALQSGRAPRAGSQLTLHVLEIMRAFSASYQNGAHVMIESACTKPEPMPQDVLKGFVEPV